MQTLEWIPGAIVAGNNINLPTGAPNIDVVVAAQIIRVPSSLADHTGAQVAAGLADHAPADVVAAIADHAAHGHDITTVVAAGGGGALTDPAVAGPLESAGGGQVNTGAVDVLAAAQAHAAGASPVAHAAGVDIAHTGADPIVAAVPTKVDEDTITLDVNTLVGDILKLTYNEWGSRVTCV